MRSKQCSSPKPTVKETPGAYALRTVKGGGQVSGSAFLKHCDVAHPETRSCPAVWENDMLIISSN